MKVFEIYSDGSCYLNDNGRGGYGAVIKEGKKITELYGGFSHSTNNRMELMGVLKALETITEPAKITVYSDSKYVTEAFNKKWIFNWIKKDYRGIKNPDLWKKLFPHTLIHNIDWVWVKAHNNGACPGNERADDLAEMGASLPNLIKDNY